jgi:hypothetical protein
MRDGAEEMWKIKRGERDRAVGLSLSGGSNLVRSRLEKEPKR